MTRHFRNTIAAIAALWLLAAPGATAQQRCELILPTPSTEPNAAQKAQIDRRYGMFIHFGVNTFNDTESRPSGA